MKLIYVASANVSASSHVVKPLVIPQNVKCRATMLLLLFSSWVTSSSSATPWTLACQTAVGCHSLLQGIFSAQGLNLCFLHWQADSLSLSHKRSPELPYDSAVLFLGILPRGFQTYPYKNLYINVSNNIIHNNKKMKATKVFSNLRIKKWDVVHPHNGILLKTVEMCGMWILSQQSCFLHV